MTKKKENRGGKRPGAGRPSGSVGEIKKNVTIKLYPSQKKKLEEKYGSVQKAVDTL